MSEFNVQEALNDLEALRCAWREHYEIGAITQTVYEDGVVAIERICLIIRKRQKEGDVRP